MSNNTNPKRILSICGDSAVGKGTLIDKLNLDEEGVRDRFRVIGSPQFFALGTKKTREHGKNTRQTGRTTYQKIGSMLCPPHSETIVFRWQYKHDCIIDVLKETFPNVDHTIYVLWRPFDEHAEDRKRLFPSGATPKRKWAKKIEPTFGPRSSRHRSGIEIELINSSKGTPDYPKVDWSDERLK